MLHSVKAVQLDFLSKMANNKSSKKYYKTVYTSDDNDERQPGSSGIATGSSECSEMMDAFRLNSPPDRSDGEILMTNWIK